MPAPSPSATPAPEARPLRPDWHYHFLGIGGIGMSALAEILHGRGIRVSGSDQQGSATLEALGAAGIPVRVGHVPQALQGADAVVYTTAIGADHAIWGEVERLGIPAIHRAELLARLAAGQRTIAVCGTHGKTTTTAALAHVLTAAGWDPTALVGGHVAQLNGRNYRLGGSAWLVCEADESDGSFLHLAPEAIVLTNIEADHLDHHGSLDNLVAAFGEFLRRLPPGGVLVYGADDPAAEHLCRAWPGRAVSYGTAEQADVRVHVERLDRNGTALVLIRRGRQWRLASPLVGHHNAANLCAVFALAMELGMPETPLLAALGEFRGVERRQQYLGRVAGLEVYDDYAHHPTEIRATLETFLVTHGEPLTVIFQPHLYSRTAHFADAFSEALRPATRIYVTEIYGARERPVEGVSGRMLVDRLRGHRASYFLPHWRELVPRVEAGEIPPGVLLTLGAGDITGLGPLLLGMQS